MQQFKFGSGRPQWWAFRRYAGIGDITTVAKYIVLAEGEVRPAVTLVGGMGWPSGHASHLNPVFLGQDAIGTGSFTFTT